MCFRKFPSGSWHPVFACAARVTCLGTCVGRSDLAFAVLHDWSCFEQTPAPAPTSHLQPQGFQWASVEGFEGKGGGVLAVNPFENPCPHAPCAVRTVSVSYCPMLFKACLPPEAVRFGLGIALTQRRFDSWRIARKCPASRARIDASASFQMSYHTDILHARVRSARYVILMQHGST